MIDIQRYETMGRPPIIHKMSFGKDSYACLMALLEAGVVPSHVIYNETGWEATYHYDYLEREKRRLLETWGIDVITCMSSVTLTPEQEIEALRLEALAGVPSPSPMIRTIIQKSGFFPRPGRGANGGKWCTKDLKLKPTMTWINEQDIDPEPILTSGVRSEESITRAAAPPWEKTYNPPYLWDWRPIKEWLVSDVGAILTRHGIPVHPHYDKGASRVGCWPCININKAEIEILGRDDERVNAVRELEKYSSHLRHDVSAFLQAKSPDSSGQYPPVPIDNAIIWSRTSHGGRQSLLFPRKTESACDRWGWCEV